MNSEAGNREQRAIENLRLGLLALKDVGNNTEDARNALTARNVLHEELGYFGPSPAQYHFDQDTRDTLLAHARQDAAHALLNSSTALKHAKSAAASSAVCVLLLVVIIVTLLYMIGSNSG